MDNDWFKKKYLLATEIVIPRNNQKKRTLSVIFPFLLAEGLSFHA